MANTVKKKNRRLKRSVRKTLGALFLASAIVVAAIPVDDLQAATPGRADKKVTLSLNKETDAINRSNIPDVDEDDEIYTTGDGRFQFAYIYPAGYTSGPKIAVVLGYQKGGKLEGGRLEIPNTVDAYKKFSNVSTESGYAAVNKAGDFLYYKDYELVYDEFGAPVYEFVQDPATGTDKIDPETQQKIPVLDELGNQVQKKKIVYKPCFYEDRGKWEKADVNDEELYYYAAGQDSNDENVVPTLVTTDDRDRIYAAEVWYIGNQYLTDDADGGWTVKGDITEGSQGIFSGAANITTLVVGEDLTGIGNYAFYGCAGMQSITLNNGLDTIGNSAFENCVNMTTVNMDISSNVSIIGERAFYNCQALQEFTVPRAVSKIGDSAFENCYAMENIELTGNGSNVLLQEVGYDAFAGCANLKSLTFPRTYAETLDVTTFRGCSKLEFIATSANLFDLKQGDDPDYTIADFKADMLPTFYLKGNKDQALHKTATKNEIAFSYYDTGLERDVYELTVVEDAGDPNNPDDDKKVVYRVDDNDELVYCQMDTGLTTVTLPTQIGPNYIKKIDQFTFQNKCYLETITIPGSITEIAQYAFKGCHNLRDVIFLNASNLVSIGSGAFMTQDCSFHESGCNSQLEKTPALNFVGEISYDAEPFRYAMDPAEKINVGTQDEAYIKYYSGWPSHLVVQYDSETDKNTLIDYPTFKDLDDGVKYTVANYAYMTQDYQDAAEKAVAKYLGTYTGPEGTETMTDYEKEIIRAAINIVLPEGVEAIGRVQLADGTTKGLFEYNEKENELATEELGNGLVLRKTITAESLTDVADEAFKGCKYLSAITLGGDTQSIGNYAFADCAVLTSASIPASVSTLGLRPFTGCDMLSDVNFNGSSYFNTEESIIYDLDDSGNKEKIVEYLCGRSSTSVKAEDLAGIKEIYPEAFQDTNVSMVDLSQTEIADVPKHAFQDTLKLYSVVLPTTCKSIDEDAFSDSGIQQLHIPDSVTIINNNAFRDVHDGTGKPGTDKLTDLRTLEFECVEGSSAYLYAQQNNIKTSTYIPKVYYTVTFWDWDGTLLDTQEMVEAGTDAVPPEVPGRDGYLLSGWVPDYRGVTSNLAVTAQYEAIDPDTLKVTVTFLDHDDTVIKEVRILPGEVVEPPADPVREGYMFIGWQNSFENVQEDTVIYARYEKIDSSAYQLTVRFIDWDDKVLKITKVNPGEAAEPPRDPSREGYTFVGWRNDYTKVTENIDVYAEYERIDSSVLQHTVTFYDWDDKVLYTQKVDDGASAIIPQNPTREGYTFVEWRPMPTKVTKDLDVYAIYAAGTGGGSGSGDSSGSGSGNGDGNGSGNGSGDNTGSASKTYTLTVVNGSGSGSYVAGSQPIIICDEPSASQEFSHWTVDPENTKLGSKTLTATYVEMPEANVTIKAHYKAKENTGGTTTKPDTNRPSSGTVNNGNTTVVIDKNGLSNTGVVSVVVNGSSDNFTIKIAESTSATEAVIKALQNEYGDISHLKYFPMDITLYDSTGTKKITDTTGLSIRITLPLPDSLAAYAGNNKVAGVVNGKLDKLNAKFTTISGVSCISFTAEHFSPYVIYVDTNNVVAGGNGTGSGSGYGSGYVPDDTPKTGDGIHPKWFLSIGLACLSFVMFMKKDKKQKVKVKA